MADARIQIVMDGVDKTQAMFRGVSGRINNVSDSLRKMRGPALAITGLMGVLGGFAVKSASSLTEAINKAELAFRDAIGPIKEFAETSAKSIGISKRDALDYTAVLGTIINASGLTREASAKMAIQFTKLAADLASVNDIPIADALRALRSGLVGEVEPLRRFGILLSASALEAKALELGLIAVGEQMDESAKVQARAALIFEKTVDQQGDAVNTATSFANAMKRLKSQFTDVSAELGMVLLPHLEKMLDFLNEGISVFTRLTDKAKTMIFAIGGIALGLGALVLVLPFVLGAMTALISVFTFAATAFGVLVGVILSPIGLIVLAIGALALAWHQNWFGMRKIVSEVLKVVDKIFTRFINASIDGINLLIKGWNSFSKMTGWKDIIDEIEHIESGFELVGEAVGKFKEVGVDTFETLLEQLDAMLFKTGLEIEGLGDWSDALENLRFEQEKLNKEMEKTNEILKPDAHIADMLVMLQNKITGFLAGGGTEAQIAPLRAQMRRMAEQSGMTGIMGILGSPFLNAEQAIGLGGQSLQSGGIVPGPIGRAIPIMAHGGEEVIPAERVGGGNTIIINAMSLGADPLERRRVVEEIAAEFGLLLAEEQRTR
jgi:hypothetical protein